MLQEVKRLRLYKHPKATNNNPKNLKLRDKSTNDINMASLDSTNV